MNYNKPGTQGALKILGHVTFLLTSGDDVGLSWFVVFAKLIECPLVSPYLLHSYPAHNQSNSGSLKKPGLVSPSHPPPAPPISSPQGARPGFAPPPAPPPPPPMNNIPPPPPLTGFQTAGMPPPPSPSSFPPHPDFAAPPPPPPPTIIPEYAIVPPPPQPTSGAPPPPPPPPPPGPPPSSFGGMDGPEASLPQPDSVSSKAKSSLPSVSEARSDLLSAIRQGECFALLIAIHQFFLLSLDLQVQGSVCVCVEGNNL